MSVMECKDPKIIKDIFYWVMLVFQWIENG